MKDKMRYIAMQGVGGVDVLHVAEMPVPRPKPGQVLIKNMAVGVNRPDIAQRLGKYPPPPDASPVLGLEVAGEICMAACSEGESLMGQKFCALVSGGGYAEYSIADIPLLLPYPEGFSDAQAAGLPEISMTVWANLFYDNQSLKKGETLLVHGGSSGIGHMAIQLAKQVGANAITTVGNDEKVAFCKKLGADCVINYRTQDFAEICQNYGDGIDVILDMVGGDYINKHIQLIKPFGRIIFISFLAGSLAKVDFMPLQKKRVTITGSTLRSRSLKEKAAIAQALRSQVWAWLSAGKITPTIARTYRLSEVAKAHQYMQSGKLIGKIIIQI